MPRRSTKKEVVNLIHDHIIERVYDENGNGYKTIERASTRLIDEFERGAGYTYNLRKFPNRQARFIDWMCGLPFNFEYSHHGQTAILKEWLQSEKEYDCFDTLNRYYSLIYREANKKRRKGL